MVERLCSGIIVDARAPAALTMHLFENVSMKKPVMEFGSAHAERIL